MSTSSSTQGASLTGGAVTPATPADTPAPRSGSAMAMDAILLASGKIVGSLSIMVLFILLSRLLSTTEYGTFRQAWLINRGLLDLLTLGLPMSVFYFLPRLRDEQKKIFIVQSIVLITAAGAVGSALIFLTAPGIAALFDNPRLVQLLRILALYPLFAMSVVAMQSILVSLGHAVRFAAFVIVDKVALTIVATAVVLADGGLAPLFWALVIFAMIEFTASLAMVAWHSRHYRLVSRQLTFARQVAVALPSGMANIVSRLNGELDKIFVSSFFSVEQFARYANGATEVPFIGTIVSAVTSVLVPEYVRSHEQGQPHRVLELWHGGVTRVALMLVPMMVGLFVFAEPLITLMFSERYADSAPIFQIYLLAIVPQMTWYGAVLVAVGRTREPFHGSVLAVLLNLILNTLLIYTVGFVGPALATVLTAYVVAGYFLWRLKQALDVGWAEVYPWRRVGAIVLLSAGAGAVAWPVRLVPGLPQVPGVPGLVELVLGGVVFSLIVLTVFWWSGFVNRRTLSRLADMVFGRLGRPPRLGSQD